MPEIEPVSLPPEVLAPSDIPDMEFIEGEQQAIEQEELMAPPIVEKPAPQRSAAKDLLAKAEQHFYALNNFKGIVTILELNAENKQARTQFDMVSNHQGQVRLEVLDHPIGLAKGAILAYTAGTGSVTARAGGLMSFITAKTPMSDERVSSARGYQLDQVDILATAQRLLRSDREVQILGKRQIAGREVAVLEFSGSNDFDSGITRERLGIALDDHFIVQHEMYIGEQKVFSLELSNMRFNLSLKAKDFQA